MRYFTSDWHLGHGNILRYANRPFPTTGAMAAHLIARWNAVVADGDEVWILGDLAMGRIDESLPLVADLRGRVVLVPGNHDRCWAGWTHRRHSTSARQEWRERYLAAGIDEIVDDPEPLAIGDELVALSHFPYQGSGDHTEEERYPEWRLQDRGGWLLCGHVHDLFRQRGRMVNVGADAWGGELVSERQVEDLIAGGPADLAPVPWPARPGAHGHGSRPREVEEAVLAMADGPVSDRALRRARARLGERWAQVPEALREDGLEALADELEQRLAVLEQPPAVHAPALLSGDDLIRLGVPQGPEVGRLLAEIAARAATGELASEGDARAWVLQRHAAEGPTP